MRSDDEDDEDDSDEENEEDEVSMHQNDQDLKLMNSSSRSQTRK